MEQFSDEQLRDNQDPAGWTGKDLLAQIAIGSGRAWDCREMADGDPRRLRTTETCMSVEDSTIDTIDAVLHQRAAEWTLSQVNAELDKIHGMLVAVLTTMPTCRRQVLVGPWSSLEPDSDESCDRCAER